MFDFFRKRSWSIAIKAPLSRNYQTISNGLNKKFVFGSDIDEWIQQKIGKSDFIIAYNDQPPNDIKPIFGSKGHCKGVFMWNKNKIYWLIHSVPLWPIISIRKDGSLDISKIPDSQCEYGQSFIWITIPNIGNTLNDLLYQIAHIDAKIYLNFSTIKFDKFKVTNKVSVVDLGKSVSHVGKGSKWGKDIFGDDLCYRFGKCYVETWMRPGIEETEDVKYVRRIKWNGNSYNHGQDHSKLAFSQNEKKPWIFIGDINYQKSQASHGGGGIVIVNRKLWKKFQKIIYVEKNM